MALIDVHVMIWNGPVTDQMEDFAFAALNNGDQIKLSNKPELFTLKSKKVMRTNDGSTQSSSYYLFV